jgi:D-aspartate ligase
MRTFDTSVPVVVLRPDHYGSLSLIRSLGRIGVPVYCVGSDPKSPGMLSRYCRDKFITNVDTANPRELVEFLHGVARQLGGRPILTCTNDTSSTFIADHSESLRQSFLFPNICRDLVRTLCDKELMFYLCKKHGIPTAETSFPQSRQDILDFLASGAAVFPIMLKGIDGALLEQQGKPKMVIVRYAQELLEQYDRIEDPSNPNLMLQEYIAGGDDSVWMFNGYFNKDSECLLGFAGRKLRQHPVYTGATSLGILLRNNAVEETTREFMKAIRYRGVLDIGYRFDARNGQYKALDINPRVGATFRLFLAQNGMDVVRAMYLDLTGQIAPRALGIEGRKWVLENGDLISFRDYHRDGRITFLEWIRSFRGVQEGAWFAADDLVPFMHMLGDLFGRFLRWFDRKLGLTKEGLKGLFNRAKSSSINCF